MKKLNLHIIIWMIVGCLFAEATFLVVKTGLTVFISGHYYMFKEFLNPKSAIYAVPPNFLAISTMFFMTVLYGQWKRIYQVGYYVFAGLITALIYHVLLWRDGYTIHQMDFVFNLIAAAVSGLVYWMIVPRRIR